MSDANKKALLEFVLRLGDNNNILSHRLGEWCSNGPILEEDIAMTNIALDYIGQARILYTYAGEIEGGKTEDFYAYERREDKYTNALLTEVPNGNFADTIARQLYYSVFAHLLLTELLKSSDSTLSGYAAKALKETAYHLRHAKDWTCRLGDGTEESKQKMQEGLNEMYRYTKDLFATTENEKLLVKQGVIPDVPSLHKAWTDMVAAVVKEATLSMPDAGIWQMEGSRTGRHTESLGYILAEMQYVTRAYPGCQW